MNIRTLIIASVAGISAAISYAEEAVAVSSETPKEVNTLADISVLGDTLKKFSASFTADYESEYMFRGKELAQSVLCPQINIGYDIGAGFGAYAGWWGCYSVDNGSYHYEENDIYAGVTYSIENFTIDFCYTAYTYPRTDWSNENELKLAVSYDTSEFLGDFAVSPYVAGYYNLTYSGTTIEAGLTYSAPVTKWILGQNWGSIDSSVYGGYADYKAGMSDMGGYAYAGFAVNAVVRATEYWTFSAGFRYACNNDNDGGYAAVAGKESNVWFGASTSIGF